MAYQALPERWENGNNVGGQITVYESGSSTGSNAKLQRANLPVERFRSMQEMA